MAHYTPIALQDIFPHFLNPDKGWASVNVPRAKEHVFDWPVEGYPGVVVRVWSSISKLNGVGRKVGSDAIRVCAVDTETDKGLVAAARVHRVEGWRQNLRSRIIEVLLVAKERAAWKKEAALKKAAALAVKEAAEKKAAEEVPAGFRFPTFKFKKDRQWWFRMRLASDANFAYRALEIVYAGQTSEEQMHGSTYNLNGIGFSGCDAEILSSFAEQLEKKRVKYGAGARLSPKQEALVMKKMKKYAKQIIGYFEAEGVLAT